LTSINIFTILEAEVNTKLTKAYLTNHDVNVVVASWGGGAKTPCYNWAARRVPKIGAVVAEFLDFMLGSDESTWKELTVVGHSLGAHIAGFAGKQVTKGRVGKIVGLDPGWFKEIYFKFQDSNIFVRFSRSKV
jgi:pancreatic triacylglycerol lipase